MACNCCCCLRVVSGFQFACDTTGLAECVAEKLNTSAAMVTPCLIRSLNVSLEGGLEACPSRGPSCPFPEVMKPLPLKVPWRAARCEWD